MRVDYWRIKLTQLQTKLRSKLKLKLSFEILGQGPEGEYFYGYSQRQFSREMGSCPARSPSWLSHLAYNVLIKSHLFYLYEIKDQVWVLFCAFLHIWCHIQKNSPIFKKQTSKQANTLASTEESYSSDTPAGGTLLDHSRYTTYSIPLLSFAIELIRTLNKCSKE